MKRGLLVEKDFMYNGLRCVVVLTSMGHRCGYVGVNKSHPLYGYNVDVVETSLYCHGGITFAKGGPNTYYPVHSDLWWFGFDCAHCYDVNDFDAALEAFEDIDIRANLLSHKSICESFPTSGTVKTTDYCVDECKKLAEQLSGIIRKEN